MIDQKEYQVLDHGWVRYIQHMGTDYVSAHAARQSFDHDKSKRSMKDDHLNRHLIGSDPMHGVPFEHIKLTVQARMPRVVYWQWFKHRVQAQSEQPFDVFEMRKVSASSTHSARYKPLSDFYVPAEENLNKQDADNKQGRSEELVDFPRDVQLAMYRALERIHTDFGVLVDDAELAFEAARLLNTDAHYTTTTITADVRGWLDFLRQRLDPHAQWEIRQYAQVVEQIIQQLWPNIHAGWAWFVRDSFRLSVGHQRALTAWVKSGGLAFASETELLDVRGQYGMGRREASNLWGFMVRSGLIDP